MTGPQKRPKHVPERTCVVCRRKRPKWEMVRVVRTPQGTLEIDNRGKKAGRGAYLCKDQECWEAGLIKKRLEYALKTTMDSEQRAELLEHCKATLANGKDVAGHPGLQGEGACK